MKKIILSILFFYLINNFSVALGITFTEDFSNQFYKYENNKLVFKPYSLEKIKSLEKNTAKSYKQILKAQKYYDKAFKTSSKYEQLLTKSTKYNPYLWMSYYKLSENFYNKQDYFSSIDKSDYILLNTNVEQFPLYYKSLIIKSFSYYNLNAYDIAYETAQLFIKDPKNRENKEVAYWILANSLLYKNGDKSKNFNEALIYANKYLNSNKLDFKINAHEIRYDVFMHQKRNDLAEKEARILIELWKVGKNYIKLANCVKNRNEKIKYLKEANTWGLTEDEFNYCFFQIARIEQSKIDDAVKNLGIYVKKPDMQEIVQSTKNGSLDYWYKRIEKFFESTNKCIENYKGQNLVACFNQVNEEQEKLTRQLDAYVFMQKQLAYQEELIRQEQLQSYYQSQNAYYARQNYYESTRPKTYTVTPIGNTYHVNQW